MGYGFVCANRALRFRRESGPRRHIFPCTEEDYTMRKLLLLSLALASPLTFAATQCTTADKSQWQDQDKFQADLKAQGYEINKFKVTDGNCYEIYGHNKDGKKVEIYFDPVSGDAVKSNVES